MIVINGKASQKVVFQNSSSSRLFGQELESQAFIQSPQFYCFSRFSAGPDRKGVVEGTGVGGGGGIGG